MVHLTVNGRPVTVPEGTVLLEAIRLAGFDLPTLCYHEGLAPYGACRLCMAAITAPRSALVASCAYPAEEGLSVDTAAPQAVAARRMALEFLVSRVPGSDLLRDMAAREGVMAARFTSPPPAGEIELCVLCGLCVRVCREAIGAAALCFVGRGSERRVGTPFDLHAEACIGCGACAEICPTGAIRIEDRGSQRILHTWHTTVDLVPCPGCGRFYAPRPLALLAEVHPEVAELWSLCPNCRQAQTSRQWLDSRTR
jgi:bidirectional [NiFe] hydrogenase diaphorase subunit